MRLSNLTKSAIIVLSRENYTQAQIAKKLKINQSTVSRILKKYEKHGCTDHLIGKDSQKSLDSNDLKVLTEINNKNSKTSLRKMAGKLFNKTGKKFAM